MVNSRRKGINGELEACKLWRPYFPEVRRSFGQSRQGYEQPDLIGGMIERSFYIEVKRTKKPPTEGQIEKWRTKVIVDYAYYTSMGGEESKYILIMWRADGRKDSPQKWQVLLLTENGLPSRMTWEDFETQINKRFFVYSPNKKKKLLKLIND